MRSLCVLGLVVALLLLAASGPAWIGASAPTTNGPSGPGHGAGGPRLVGRADAAAAASSDEAAAARVGPSTETIEGRLVGPSARPLAPALLRRLTAMREADPETPDDLEYALQSAEADLTNELAHPAGVLLAGRERGEGPDVDRVAWIDDEDGRFEASLRAPHDVEALLVYGGRILARARLAPPGTDLVVDPATILAPTGTLELGFVRGDTGDAVADVAVEISAVHRDVSAETRIDEVAGAARPVRPLRLEDLPPGTYHVRAEAPGRPGRVGAATVEVRPGAATRATIALAPAASLRMRWFRPDGRPLRPVLTTVILRDAGNRCHEVAWRTAAEDPDVLVVDLAPPGAGWLVTPDHRAHPLPPCAGEASPVLDVHLAETIDVVLRVRVDELPPKALASRAHSVWTVSDASGVIVQQGTLAITSVDDDGSLRAWAELPPGRYGVRWQLGPERAVDETFQVPPGVEEIEIDLGAAGA